MRCTRQSALIVAGNVKSPSNPTRTGQFTAESAGLKEDHKVDLIEDTRYVGNSKWVLID